MSVASKTTTGLGVVATAVGVEELVEGKGEKGLFHAAAGLAALNAGAMGDHLLISSSIIGGAATGAIKSLGCVWQGISRRDVRETAKGVAQFAVGATAAAVALATGPKVTSVASQTLACAGQFGMIAYSGVKDIAHGEYRKGIAKTAVGVGGIALSGWCAYQLLGNPTQAGELKRQHDAEWGPDHDVVTVARNCTKLETTAPTKCPLKARANHPCENCGMFATNLYLVGVLDRFEKGEYSGVKIDFGKNGLYYDPSRGPNWFEYYFRRVNIVDQDCCMVGDPKAFKLFTDHELGDLSSYAERVYGYEQNGLSPERARYLIEKYMVLKPEIQSEFDQFTNNHFSASDYVIGVHYRGTDKTCNSANCEARRVTYGEMTSTIKDHVEKLEFDVPTKVQILAASDEAPFIEHLKKQFPGQVIASPAQRSTDGKPLHFNAKDPYQTGKEALLDCWLLGKLSNTLIKTSSNLSKFASLLLREGARVVEVSKRYYQDPAVAAGS